MSNDFLTRVIGILSDSELEEARSMLYFESQKRVRANISANKYPPLSDHERNMAMNNNRVCAIKSYKERTNLSLMEAKEIVDYFLS